MEKQDGDEDGKRHSFGAWRPTRGGTKIHYHMLLICTSGTLNGLRNDTTHSEDCKTKVGTIHHPIVNNVVSFNHLGVQFAAMRSLTPTTVQVSGDVSASSTARAARIALDPETGIVYATVEEAAEFGLDVKVVRLEGLDEGASFPEVR
jgi:hypothetical protein